MNYAPITSSDFKPRVLTADELEAKRNDASVQVLDSDVELEDWQKLDTRQSKDIIDAIRSRYLALRSECPSLTDDDIRTQLVEEGGRTWDSFARFTHAGIFTRLTDRKTTEQTLELLQFMLDVRCQVDDGRLTEKQAQAAVQTHLTQKYH